MNVIKTEIPEVLILEPTVFGDERGFFMESFNKKKFENIVKGEVEFVQDNHSCSSIGVLRGMHFQRAPHAQGKLIRCVAGTIYDVAVDIRPESETFGSWVGVILSGENKRQLWIPEGFAHGFLVLEGDAEILYKSTDYYHPELEGIIRWDDKILNIDWPKQPNTVSQKDSNGMDFINIGE